MIFQLLPAGDGEVLRAIAQYLLRKHPTSYGLPGVEPLIDQPPYCVGCGDMSGSLQYHHLEYDEPLRVPPSVPHPTHLVSQSPYKAAPYLTSWHIIEAGGHDREVMPPPLPHTIVRDAPVEVITSIGVYLVPVYLLDSEVLQGRGVTQQIYLLPFPVL